MGNTSNLCAQVMFLLSEEEWVGVDGTIQVTGEQNLNLARSFDVGGTQIRKTSPFSLQAIVCNVVGEPVHTGTTWLLDSRCTAFIKIFLTFVKNSLISFSLIASCFNNVVVLLCAPNFTEEAQLLSL